MDFEVEMSWLLVLVGWVFWGGFFVFVFHLLQFSCILQTSGLYSDPSFTSPIGISAHSQQIVFAHSFFLIAYMIDVFLAFRMSWLYARFVILIAKSVDFVLYHFGMR